MTDYGNMINPYAKRRRSDPDERGDSVKSDTMIYPYMKRRQSDPDERENAVKNDSSRTCSMVHSPLDESREVQGADLDEQGNDAVNEDISRTSPPEESASALVIAATDKAGMAGIDRARIDKIILRESGHSLYMQQQRKRDQQVQLRIDQIRNKLNKEERINPTWRKKLQHLSELVRRRPIRSTCVVIDMDMFFMACELLTRPDLVDKPACVGGSMITTSNYVARRYGKSAAEEVKVVYCFSDYGDGMTGVRSAMAGWIGDKLVEELSGGKEKLIHVKSNFELYKDKSNIVKTQLVRRKWKTTLSVLSFV